MYISDLDIKRVRFFISQQTKNNTKYVLKP